MSLLDVVSYCGFLRAMPDELVLRLGKLAHARAYSAGSVLFVEGMAHPDFHIIVEGHVRLDMQVSKRGRIPIMSAGPGDVLAWSSLVGNSVMTSTAVALEEVRTVAFRNDELMKLCEEDHEVGYQVMRQLASALARRLVATRLQLLDLFGEHDSAMVVIPDRGLVGDPEC